MRPESRVENEFFSAVKRLGGSTIKLAPTTKGVPDRLVVLPAPEAKVFFVELKADGGELSRIQKVWIKRARGQGVRVDVVTGMTGVRTWEFTERQKMG